MRGLKTGSSMHSAVRRLVPVAVVLLLSACAPAQLVQPYDEALIEKTEAVFSEASQMVGDGIANSPLTDAARAAIKPPSRSDAHFSKFEPRYETLIGSVDVLILRSMAGNGEVDRIGQTLAAKIGELIETSLPSACPELTAEFAALTTSLTVHNYVDLKCLFIGWQEQHASAEVTQGTMILKKANWEARRGALFNTVLAIERAELSKKP